MRFLLLFSTLFVIIMGCEDDLSKALADVRSSAPEVCTNYCDDVVHCGWTPYPTGEFKDEAYSSAVRECINDCAWYMDEGVYFYGPPEIQDYTGGFSKYASGGDLEAALNCLRDANIYKCDFGITPENPVPDPKDCGTWKMIAKDASTCNTINECLAQIDSQVQWNGSACVWVGQDFPEGPFFESLY